MLPGRDESYYLDMVRRHREAEYERAWRDGATRRAAEYLRHSVEREVIPSRVDSLDVRLALWVGQAMMEEAG